MNTPLGDYYDALHFMHEQELTALAKAHADDPRLLVRRFRRSIETVENLERIDARFYDTRRKAPERSKTGDVKSTIDFASYVCDGHVCTVKDGEALAFRYLDREIFPRRTLSKGADRRSLDLLLTNSHDNMPVFAELKIRGDSLAYFALIQVLMHAAEFQSNDQRARLQEKHEWGKGLNWSPEGPFADIYIIVLSPSKRGEYRDDCYKATERISERLLKDPVFARYVRRIAYLEAFVENDVMTFEKCFAFGVGL